MYAVVGCSECSALWVIEGRPETTTCPRCGTRHQTDQRKRFVETEDKAKAREIRASMLANRQGEREAFANVGAYDDLEAQLETAGVDDETYLGAKGVDPTAAEAAGERALDGAGGSQSRKETIREGIRTLETPTETELIEYATDRGVPAETVTTAVEKLQAAGEITKTDDGYRLL